MHPRMETPTIPAVLVFALVYVFQFHKGQAPTPCPAGWEETLTMLERANLAKARQGVLVGAPRIAQLTPTGLHVMAKAFAFVELPAAEEPSGLVVPG
jgi:hypothetical protein